MIKGIGTDMVLIERIAKSHEQFGQKFLDRLFTKHEQEFARARLEIHPTLAKRFAAKEAFVKAVGTGISKGLSWTEIEVINDELGKPDIILHGRTKEILQNMFNGGSLTIHLSLTDTDESAIAFVVIEQLP